MRVLYYINNFDNIFHFGTINDIFLALALDARASSEVERKILAYDQFLNKIVSNGHSFRERAEEIDIECVAITSKNSIINYKNETVDHFIPGWIPDVIISIGDNSKFISYLYPNSIIVEYKNTDFGLFNKAPDFFPIIHKNGTSLDRDALGIFPFSEKDRENISNYIDVFKKYTLLPNVISREFFDKDNKFKKILFFPENEEGLYRHNSDSYIKLAKDVLSILPEDCAIIIDASRNSLDRAYIEFSGDQRVIFLDDMKYFSHSMPAQIINACDAVLSLDSYMTFVGFVLDKPVFGLGERSWVSSWQSGTDCDALKLWLLSEGQEGKESASPEAEDRIKLLHYVLTRSMSQAFFRHKTVSLDYLAELKDRAEAGVELLALPPVRSPVSESAFAIESACTARHSNRIKNRLKAADYEKVKASIFSPELQAVGFDIFDTLLVRQVTGPADVFSCMEPMIEKLVPSRSLSFRKMRVLAETVSTRRASKEGNRNVGIDAIYAAFSKLSGIDEAIVEKIKAIELETEKSVLTARRSVKPLFDCAVLSGKIVLVVSDMYLPSSFLEEVLKKNGYQGHTALYVSWEHNKTKRDGSLFDHVIEDHQIEASKFLFVGDNPVVDIQNAKKHNMQTVLVEKPMSVFEKNPFYRGNLGFFLDKNANICAPFLGIVANKIYDDPFLVNKKSIVNESTYLLGYCFYGPLMLSAAVWLANNVQRDQVDNLLFATRDGYLIRKIYTDLNKRFFDSSLPKGSDFYGSRRSTFSLLLDLPLNMLATILYNPRNDMTIEKFLETYLGVTSEDEEIGQSLDASGIQWTNKLKSRGIELQEWVSENRAWLKGRLPPNYSADYWAQEIGEAKNAAIFDLSGRMTSQRIVTDISGYSLKKYVLRSLPYRMEQDGEVTFYHQVSANPYAPNLQALPSPLLEPYFSTPFDETCEGYEKKANGHIEPVFKKTPFDLRLYEIARIQAAIKDFCDDYIAAHGRNTLLINNAPKEIFIAPVSMIEAFGETLHDELSWTNLNFHSDKMYSGSSNFTDFLRKKPIPLYDASRPPPAVVRNRTRLAYLILFVIGGENSNAKLVAYLKKTRKNPQTLFQKTLALFLKKTKRYG